LVTISVTADTSNVVPETFGGLLPSGKVNVGTGIVSIPGVGTATITGCTSTPSCTNSVAIYSTGTPVSFDGLPLLPYVLIGTVDFPPATDNFTGLAAVGSNALLGYGLQTAISPISGSPGGVFYPTGLFVHTTLGDLSFTSNFEPDMGPGIFTVTTVPEPSSLLLLSTGVWLFVGLASRNRGHN
jgi:hypothetical protein